MHVYSMQGCVQHTGSSSIRSLKYNVKFLTFSPCLFIHAAMDINEEEEGTSAAPAASANINTSVNASSPTAQAVARAVGFFRAWLVALDQGVKGRTHEAMTLKVLAVELTNQYACCAAASASVGVQ